MCECAGVSCGYAFMSFYFILYIQTLLIEVKRDYLEQNCIKRVKPGIAAGGIYCLEDSDGEELLSRSYKCTLQAGPNKTNIFHS